MFMNFESFPDKSIAGFPLVFFIDLLELHLTYTFTGRMTVPASDGWKVRWVS